MDDESLLGRTSQPSSYDERVSENRDVQAAFDQLTRKDASLKQSSSASSYSPPSSFTQRLIDRGVPVPSFPNWERARSQQQQQHNLHNRHLDQQQQQHNSDQDLSSSTGSLVNEFDSSAYFGLSPFVNSSFSTNGILPPPPPSMHPYQQQLLQQQQHQQQQQQHQQQQSSSSSSPQTSSSAFHDTKYLSLRHRYERERAPQQHRQNSRLSSRRRRHSDGDLDDEHDSHDPDEDEDHEHVEDGDDEGGTNGSPGITKVGQLHNHRLQHMQHEDSDIELSDDDLEKHSPGLAPPAAHHSHHSVSSPFLWRTANRRKTDKYRSPSPLAPPLGLSSSNHEDDNEKQETKPPPSSMERFNNILAMKGYNPANASRNRTTMNIDVTTTTIATATRADSHTTQQYAIPTVGQEPKSVRNSPRTHLLHTPVFEVVNANTIKDRYLFLFNDLLLICKPIMDENIIVGGGSGGTHNNYQLSDTRYRFRPNENSLFQVKNIVELSKLTLYLSQEDQQQQSYHQRQSRPISLQPLPPSASSSATYSSAQPLSPPPPPRKMHPILASALKKFKSSAESGIAYLLDKQVLTLDPLSIANFLFKTPDLNRRQLGHYLGDRKHADVYDAFLDCFRLVGLRLDEALRILLTTFRLPSHWESLEYVVERFAKKWHDANQNVVKFHEDMVVKVVVAMLFLNAEVWYDADPEKDVFWHARKQKEKGDRQRLIRRATTMDQCRHQQQQEEQSTTSDNQHSNKDDEAVKSATMAMRASTVVDHHHHHHHHHPRFHHRGSVAFEPLHYITALREKSAHQPTLQDFLERWTYYDQYTLVPPEFMEEMYRSIIHERLETGLEKKTTDSDGDEQEQEDNSEIINVTPHRLPTRLIRGVASTPITLSITQPDPGLQIKLRGQDLLIQPNILDFSTSATQSFTITGNTLGRTSLMFIKSGVHAGNYVSPTLPRTKTMVVERSFMRYTFQVAFSHTDMRAVKAAAMKAARSSYNKSSNKANNSNQQKNTTAVAASTTSSSSLSPSSHVDESDEALSSSAIEQEGSGITPTNKANMVKRRYMFSVETEEEKQAWLSHLAHLCGCVVWLGGGKPVKNMHQKKPPATAEERVALQVLKELLLADEVKKGTASVALRTTTATTTTTTKEDTNEDEKRIKGHDSSNSNNGEDDTLAIERHKEMEGNRERGTAMNNLDDDNDDNDGNDKQKKKEEAAGERGSLISLSGGATNVVTKRGYDIIRLVVQNAMVPFMLGFLRSQIE